MHRLNLRTINPIHDRPAHRERNDKNVDERDDGPFSGGGGGGATRVEGADGEHGAGDDETATDHGGAAAPCRRASEGMT